MSDFLWVVNKSSKEFSKVDVDLKKLITMKPYRPIQLPRRTAMKYISFKTLFICQNPEHYFNKLPMERLIIRDAGIGDLLLLEPLLRKMSKDGHKISILTRFPAVFKYNPYIENVYTMNKKAEIPDDIDVNKWDMFDDLRSYSETCPDRDKLHRTDCYNQVFSLEIDDKEPKIFFGDADKPVFKKKKDKRYIGLACDGSHFFRRYNNGIELIDYILAQDSSNYVVILGDGWTDAKGFVKYDHRNKRVINLQGKTTIRQLMNVVKDLDYLVSVDTGIMHIGLTLHIPTVCIFSIIAPELRIKYYTGRKEIIYKDELACIGCGSWHMAKCSHVDLLNKVSDIIKKTNEEKTPPCLKISVQEIYNTMEKMFDEKEEPRIFINEKKEVPVSNVNVLPIKRLIMPIIVLNEEKNLPRFIELVMSHKSIGKVIAIDGGSDDKTIDMLKKAGAKVYIHYYDKDYHDMQALQRNISCSFVKDGEKIIIMDIDECFSAELSEYLPALAASEIPYGLLSRRTFDYYNDINDPTKQIKDYPDYQPRFFTWQKHFKWVGSPHHNIYNCPEPVKINKDIIHFEKEAKDRNALENKWAIMEKATKEVYG